MQENPKDEDGASRSPESTLDQFQSRFGNTGFSRDKIWPMTKKTGSILWSAGKTTVAFGVRQAINAGATSYLLPYILPKVLPAPIGTKAAEAASHLIDKRLRRFVQEGPADSVAEAMAPSARERLLDKTEVKRVAKTIKFDKFDKAVSPFLNIFTDGKLTLQENAQRFADAVGEETRQFEEDHPELKEQFGLLREKVKAYQPKFADQADLDRDILAVLITPKIMSKVPYLSKESLENPGAILKTPETQKLFDTALADVLKMAEDDEVENPDDIRIFHERWRNLTLSDDMPFMRMSGEGALENAREWCNKVDEKPMEVDADDLAEMLTGSRPKEAKPRVAENDPSPIKQLGGFYSRIESGNPASPMIITGFDSKNPDHANLILLLEGANEICFPYGDVPRVFNFNTKGMPVFLCEDEPATSKKVTLDVPAGDKAAAGDKGKKDKVKDKAKDKTPADDKAKAKDKDKDKAKDKGSDGEKTNNKGFEKLKVIPSAVFKSPSEKRRSKKLEEVLETKVVDRLDTIVQMDSPYFSAGLKNCIKDTAGQDEHKKRILKKSMEHKITLKQTEGVVLYLVEHIAAKYRQSLAQMESTDNPEQNPPVSAETDAENRINAFNESAEKKEIDQSLGKFIENYFKRFEKDDVAKSEDTDGEEKKKALSASYPAWFEHVDSEEMMRAFPIPISAQGKQPLSKGQTTLDNYLKPEVLDPLLAAAKRGDTEALKQQLGDPASNLKKTDKKGNTALHLAVQNGHIDVIRILLQHPDVVNINAQNSSGSTALHLAIGKGNKKLVDLLLENPEAIDFSLQDRNKRTLIEAAGELAGKQGMNANTMGIISVVMGADPKTSSAKLLILQGGDNAKSGN